MSSHSVKYSPISVLSLLLVFCLLLSAFETLLLLQVPAMGVRLVTNGEAVVVEEILPGSANTDRLALGTEITSFVINHETKIPAKPELLIEEPDMLDSYAAYNRFLDDQSALFASIKSRQLGIETDDGNVIPMQFHSMRVGWLPGTYWLQLVFGSAAILLAFGAVVFAKQGFNVWLYAITGLGFACSCFGAAPYSTRELALGEPWFRLLSIINHIGVYAFAGALLALLWNYPKKLTRFPVTLLAGVVSLVGLLIDIFQWVESPATGLYAIVLLIYLFTFPAAWLQWRASRHNPMDRAALRWFLMAVYLGTGIYSLFMLVPAALGQEAFASQSLMLGAFLFIYAGIALALFRYRLFDVEQWWQSSWYWLLGVLVGATLWLLLQTLLSIEPALAGLLSLALVGSVSVLLRQRFLKQVATHRRKDLLSLIPKLIGHAFAVDTQEELEHTWHKVLKEAYRPRKLQHQDTDIPTTQVLNGGLSLLIRHPFSAGATLMDGPEEGGRLFNRNDLRLAETLQELLRCVYEALEAKSKVVGLERERIMRDLHDDLGGKLLAMVYTAEGTASETLAREAMQDMRDVVQTLAVIPKSLDVAISEWRYELNELATLLRLQLAFHFDQPISGSKTEECLRLQLNPRQHTNISRILREAVTNAAKHAKAEAVDVELVLEEECLMIFVSHSALGVPDPRTWEQGKGMRSIHSRSADLGGKVSWGILADEDRVICTVVLPYTP